ARVDGRSPLGPGRRGRRGGAQRREEAPPPARRRRPQPFVPVGERSPEGLAKLAEATELGLHGGELLRCQRPNPQARRPPRPSFGEDAGELVQAEAGSKRRLDDLRSTDRGGLVEATAALASARRLGQAGGLLLT